MDWISEIKKAEALGKAKMAHQVLDLIEDFYQSSRSPDVRLLACSVRLLLRQANQEFNEQRASKRQSTKDLDEPRGKA